jgi:uncharacterized RDD family membrane protein YckC/pSer/pThr/pTyr-binding forkhead associated (FHA) protein
MAKINYMDRDNVLREYELGDEAITLGREATNKVVIADPSVSRQHAWIEKRPDGYYLVDKNSSNGTYINGKKVSQQKLNHSDKVNLGSASLVFEDEEEGATFILDRGELADVTRSDTGFSPAERPTDALTAADALPEDRPLPPPPPLVSGQSPPQAPPQPKPAVQSSVPSPPAPPSPPPTPQAPPVKVEPEAPKGILCPSCRKVVEAGARFCPFCGASLGASKTATPPAPPPPPAAAQKSAAPPPPIPQSAAPASPRPPIPQSPPVASPQRPPAPPSLGLQPPPPPVAAVTGALNYAGFGVRLVASLIDGLLLSALMIPFIILIGVFMVKMQNSGEPSPLAFIVISASYVIIIVASLIYQLIFIGKKGATPGKKFMKLRVTFPDGQYPIGIGKAFLRMIGTMLSGMICMIGYLMIIFDKEQHRALHDRIAGTVVIREI